MANPRFAWGIDIGNRALKAIKLVRDGETLRMEDVEVIEHEQVLSNSGDNRESLIQTALANFTQRHMTKGGVVAVGVSGQSSFARFIKLPPVEEKKIPEIVKFEAIQQIPFPLEQVEWSYQLFRQADSPDVEVGIFAMRKELVNQQIKYFTDMDMNVQVVQMSPLAVYNAMYYDNRLADGTTMILDLGAENADLIIAEGESVWLRSVPIGGNNFTEALVKAFKLNFAKAEELKRNAQTSKYARQIFQAMRPIFADLVAEIQRSIGFYSSVHRDSRIKRIVALGNTFRLPTLQKYLQQNLQIEVERLDAFSAGAPDDGRLAAVLNDNIASMAGAYGLALQAMDQGKIESSLLPQEIRKAKIWREKTKWFALAASICVVAAGVKYGTYYFHNDKFENNATMASKNDGIIRIAEDNDRKWQAVENAGGPDKTRISNVLALQNYRDTWADLFYDITKALPAQNAQSPEKLKATPRGDRQQIFIDSFNSYYQPDIGKSVALDAESFKLLAQTGTSGVPNGVYNGPAPATGGGGGGFVPGTLDDGGHRIDRTRGGAREGGFGRGRGFTPPPPMPTPSVTPGAEGTSTGERGYIITLQLTSPYKSATTLVEQLLTKNLMEQLSQISALKDHKNYYIARAMIVSRQQISSDENRKSAIKAAFDAKHKPDLQNGDPRMMRQVPGRTGGLRGRGFPINNPVRIPEAAKPDAKLEADPYADPLYPKENVLNDWVFTVVVAVVLDPKAPDAAPGTSTAAADLAPDRTAAVR
jgi:type IV pilus assembly protein PilM